MECGKVAKYRGEKKQGRNNVFNSMAKRFPQTGSFTSRPRFSAVKTVIVKGRKNSLLTSSPGGRHRGTYCSIFLFCGCNN